jgi:hypothetical protein
MPQNYKCHFCSEDYKEAQETAILCEIDHLQLLKLEAIEDGNKSWEKSLIENIRTHQERLKSIRANKLLQAS